mgnify:CR=1 FL=1
MATSTKYIIGFLVLVVAISGIIITLNKDVRINVGSTYSTFYVNENGKWLVSGKETNKLFLVQHS